MKELKEKLIGCTTSSYIKTFKYFEYFNDDYKKNSKYLGYLRFLEWKEDLAHIASKYLNPSINDIHSFTASRRKLRMPPVSIMNERAMLKKLRGIAEICLKKYPETYEQDMEIGRASCRERVSSPM